MTLSRHHHPSPIITALSSDLGIVVVAAIVIIAVYLIDTITPLGQPVWLLYLVPLVLSYWSERYYAIPTVCIVTLLFLVGGFVASPAGIPIQEAILMRFTFFLIFICAALLLWAIRRRTIRHENLS
ncbi:MAG: hypothetical protein GYA23_10390 [Methanomicrobiales archaeon]|nr:hypothetical protein [Methanomicrobiales archaeon]